MDYAEVALKSLQETILWSNAQSICSVICHYQQKLL